MIEKYIEAILKHDYKAMAACFAPKCSYFDNCPNVIGKNSYHLYGPRGIEMFFHNKFTFHAWSISDYAIEDDKNATFFVASGGAYIFARATIEKLSPDGLIELMRIYPS